MVSDKVHLVSDGDSEGDSEGGYEKPHLFKPGDVRIPLANTSYDGVMLAVVCLVDDTFKEHHGNFAVVMQFVFAVCLHLFTLFAQTTMVFLLLTTSVQRTAGPYREGIEGRTEAISAAVSSVPPTRLADDDDAIHFCKADKTFPGSHFFILLIWGARMINEAVEAMWRLVLIFRMEEREGDEDLMSENEDDGKVVIFRNTCFIRAFQFIFVALPQLMIAFFLYYTGAKFLFYATTMAKVVLKAIGLGFIVSIDELLFKAFASMRFKVRLGRSSFMYRMERPNWHWSMWGQSLCKFIAVLVGAVLLTYVTFGPANTYRKACMSYHNNFPDAWTSYSKYDMWTTFMKGMEWE
jgi:hypothetical protein